MGLGLGSLRTHAVLFRQAMAAAAASSRRVPPRALELLVGQCWQIHGPGHLRRHRDGDRTERRSHKGGHTSAGLRSGMQTRPAGAALERGEWPTVSDKKRQAGLSTPARRHALAGGRQRSGGPIHSHPFPPPHPPPKARALQGLRLSRRGGRRVADVVALVVGVAKGGRMAGWTWDRPPPLAAAAAAGGVGNRRAPWRRCRWG